MAVAYGGRQASRSIRATKRPTKALLYAVLIALISLAFCVAYPFIATVLFHMASVDTSVRVTITRFVLAAALCSPLVALPLWGFEAVGSWLHRYRFRIGVSAVVLAVLLDINGSSMGWWNVLLGGDIQDDIVWGTPRAIRSDEYAVNTPLAFSQAYNDYGYTNSLIGNRDSDMFLIKDAPVWWIAEIFRPFHWGYLLLGSSRGLAFYWSARTVALLLCLYELFRLITRDRRFLSLLGSAVIVFSPIIQWWYAVNSLPEMIVAVSLSIVLFNRYWQDRNSWHRLGYAAVICICAGMFILSLYPACQIPLAYLLVVLIIWVLVTQRHSLSLRGRDIAGLVFCVVVTACLLGSVLYLSWPTITATLNTVYPGHRSSTGGEVSFDSLFNGAVSMLYPFRDYVGDVNAPETARILDFFPIGMILAVYQFIRIKKKDVLSILLFLYGVFTGVFAVVGFPQWLSTVTMMSMSTGNRCYLGFAIANVMLLLRCLSRIELRRTEPADKQPAEHAEGLAIDRRYIACAAVVVAVYAAVVVYLGYRDNPAYVGPRTAIASLTIAVVLGFALLFAVHGTSRIGKCVGAAALVIVVGSGVSVNPVQLSSAAIDDQPLAEQVAAVQAEDSGVWVVTGQAGYGDIIPQLLAANGVTTLNTVQVTPMMDTWRQIDPDGQWEDIYNRYAFVSIQIVEQEADEPFTLVAADRISVSLTAEQLASIGVDHVLSQDDLGSLQCDGYRFEQVSAGVDDWVAYRMVEE